MPALQRAVDSVWPLGLFEVFCSTLRGGVGVWPKSGPRTKERSWKDGERESESGRKATLLG